MWFLQHYSKTLKIVITLWCLLQIILRNEAGLFSCIDDIYVAGSSFFNIKLGGCYFIVFCTCVWTSVLSTIAARFRTCTVDSWQLQCKQDPVRNRAKQNAGSTLPHKCQQQANAPSLRPLPLCPCSLLLLPLLPPLTGSVLPGCWLHTYICHILEISLSPHCNYLSFILYFILLRDTSGYFVMSALWPDMSLTCSSWLTAVNHLHPMWTHRLDCFHLDWRWHQGIYAKQNSTFSSKNFLVLQSKVECKTHWHALSNHHDHM